MALAGRFLSIFFGGKENRLEIKQKKVENKPLLEKLMDINKK
jgi:hypothetical protein